MNALRSIAETLIKDPSFKDCEVSVNKDHNCVDVIFPDGTMSQTYAKEGNPYQSTTYDYKYVGKGNGDYVRVSRSVDRRSWESEPGITKYVNRIVKK